MNLCYRRAVFTAGHFAKKGRECIITTQRILERKIEPVGGAKRKTCALSGSSASLANEDDDDDDDARTMQIAVMRRKPRYK